MMKNHRFLRCMAALLLSVIVFSSASTARPLPAHARTGTLHPSDFDATLKIAAEAAPFQTLYPTYLSDYYGFSATLHYQNTGDVTATVAVTATNLNTGAQYGTSLLAPAGGGFALEPSDFPTLPRGEFALAVASDQPHAGIVSVRNADMVSLSSYEGVRAPTAGSGPQTTHYGPYHVEAATSSVGLWNPAATTATASIELFTSSGSSVYSSTREVPSMRATFLNSMQLAGSIPAGTYWAEVDSDTPLVGLLSTVIGPIATNRDHEMQGALDAGSPRLALPRVVKNVAEVGGPRSSTLFAGNTGSRPGNITLSFVDASGTIVTTYSHTAVPPQGFVMLDVRTLAALPDGSYAVVADATQPFALSESTAFHTPGNAVAAAYSGLTPTGPVEHPMTDYMVSLPRIARSDDTITPFNIQNLGLDTSTIQVEYFNHSGTSVSTTLHSLAPSAFTRIDPTAALPTDFEGSALVMADQPLAVRVDELWTQPCDPPTGLLIQTTPPSPVDAGTIMTFTATAEGTPPLTYGWDFDDGHEATGPTVTHSFTAPGTYSVTLTVSNTCGFGSASRAIEILPVYSHRVFLPLVVR